eukprot:4107471-Pyramimonas_sp.AAC.1
MSSEQNKLSCRGVVIVDDVTGEVRGAAMVEAVAARVAQISAKLRESFNEIDADGSGSIELHEMELLIEKICPAYQEVSHDEVRASPPPCRPLLDPL